MRRPAKLGITSLERLSTCHPDLQRVILRAEIISPLDFTVVEGIRSLTRQRSLYAQGRTAPGPKVTSLDGVSGISKHQARHNYTGLPVPDQTGGAVSYAVDLAPWPTVWERAWSFDVLAGVVLTAAQIEGVAIRWGGDWDGDWDRADQRLYDAPHFELVM